jgi:hypothetical protein
MGLLSLTAVRGRGLARSEQGDVDRLGGDVASVGRRLGTPRTLAGSHPLGGRRRRLGEFWVRGGSSRAVGDGLRTGSPLEFKLSDVRCPVRAIHGTIDNIEPYANGRRPSWPIASWLPCLGWGLSDRSCGRTQSSDC